MSIYLPYKANFHSWKPSTLKLRNPGWTSSNFCNSTFDLFSIAPRLTTVLVNKGILLFMFQHPWNQVNELKIQSTNTDTKYFLEAARKPCCVAHWLTPPWKALNQIPLGSVILTKLQPLKFKIECLIYGSWYIPPKTMEALLPALCTPSIQTLSLYRLNITNQFMPILSRMNKSLLTSLSLCRFLNLS